MVLDTERLASEPEYKAELRHKCETDHFFLAELVGFKDFHERIHRPAVNLYFPKNRDIPIVDQHPIKNRMHLDPRYTFKTTLGRVDSLQWIIAFPEEISILNESATQPLAAKISSTLAEYFWFQPGRAHTKIQLLYPELCVSKKPDGDWNTPVRRIGELDNTLSYTSPKTQQSGWHPWLLNPDDMVDTLNSGIGADHNVRKGVIDTYYTNKNTLRPGGYLNVRGTRYHPFDLYGDILEKMDPADWMVLIRSSLTVKSGDPLLPGHFPEEDDVELHFPEMLNLTYKNLRTLYFENYQAFMCQQQNDPQGGSVPVFGDPLYRSILCSPEQIPVIGETLMCWRLPFEGKDYMAEYAEGCAVRINNGRAYVLDAWSGIWNPSGLARQIVRSAKRHQVDAVVMENMPGSSHTAQDILNESYRENFPLRVQWLDFEPDDTIRKARMKRLEPQMRAGRISISTGIVKQHEVRRQIVHFGLVRENGVLDCISRLAERIPASVLRQDMSAEETALQDRRRQDDLFRHVFGQQAMQFVAERQRQEAEAHIDAMNQLNSYGLEPLPGGLDG